MFILAWLVILVLRANDIVIPHLVSFIVGLLAVIEISLYVVMLVLALLGLGLSFRKR